MACNGSMPPVPQVSCYICFPTLQLKELLAQTLPSLCKHDAQSIGISKVKSPVERGRVPEAQKGDQTHFELKASSAERPLAHKVRRIWGCAGIGDTAMDDYLYGDDWQNGLEGLGREDEDNYCETRDFRKSVRDSGLIFSLEPGVNSQMFYQVSLYKIKVQDRKFLAVICAASL